MSITKHCDIRHTHKLPPTNTPATHTPDQTHRHTDTHTGHTHRPPDQTDRHSDSRRDTLTPHTLATGQAVTISPALLPPYRASVRPYPFGGGDRSSWPPATITPPPARIMRAPRTRPHARTRNGGSAELRSRVYIYYPSSGCVVFTAHGEWWFGVFCDCVWSTDG